MWNHYKERDEKLLHISVKLHEVLFHQFLKNSSDMDEMNLTVFIRDLQEIRIDLSTLIEYYWCFGRSFVKPLAELRSKVNVYIIYLKQMRGPE